MTSLANEFLLHVAESPEKGSSGARALTRISVTPIVEERLSLFVGSTFLRRVMARFSLSLPPSLHEEGIPRGCLRHGNVCIFVEEKFFFCRGNHGDIMIPLLPGRVPCGWQNTVVLSNLLLFQFSLRLCRSICTIKSNATNGFSFVLQ